MSNIKLIRLCKYPINLGKVRGTLIIRERHPDVLQHFDWEPLVQKMVMRYSGVTIQIVAIQVNSMAIIARNKNFDV